MSLVLLNGLWCRKQNLFCKVGCYKWSKYVLFLYQSTTLSFSVSLQVIYARLLNTRPCCHKWQLQDGRKVKSSRVIKSVRSATVAILVVPHQVRLYLILFNFSFGRRRKVKVSLCSRSCRLQCLKLVMVKMEEFGHDWWADIQFFWSIPNKQSHFICQSLILIFCPTHGLLLTAGYIL